MLLKDTSNGNYMRGLSGSTGIDITDQNNGKIELETPEPPPVIHEVTDAYHQAVDDR